MAQLPLLTPIPERALRKPTDMLLRDLQALIRALCEGDNLRSVARAHAQNLAEHISAQYPIPDVSEIIDVCAVCCDSYLTRPPNPG